MRDSQGTVLGKADRVTLSLGAQGGLSGSWRIWAVGKRREAWRSVYVDDIDSDTNGSLNGARKGNLRQAIKQRNTDHNGRLIPRTIVFRESGYATLVNDPLRIKDGLLTVAGQSAYQSPGISIRGSGLFVQGKERDDVTDSTAYELADANDVIIREVRVRAYHEGVAEGVDTKNDAMRVHNASNVIVDHCSISWGKMEYLILLQQITNFKISRSSSNCAVVLYSGGSSWTR